MAATSSSAASMAPSTVTACRASTCPAWVSRTDRPDFSTSAVPSLRSSRRTSWLTAGWLYPSRSAAAVKPPSSPMARITRSPLTSITHKA